MAAPVHVLCVDDDDAVLRAIRRVFHGMPWHVTCVSDPIAASALLQAGGIDILLTDQGMPRLSGIALCARARECDPAIIRILLTGSFDRVSANEAVAAGLAECVIEKPWESAHLRRVIAEYVAVVEHRSAARGAG
jgi:CheY-like chemotaxis protein